MRKNKNKKITMTLIQTVHQNHIALHAGKIQLRPECSNAYIYVCVYVCVCGYTYVNMNKPDQTNWNITSILIFFISSSFVHKLLSEEKFLWEKRFLQRF